MSDERDKGDDSTQFAPSRGPADDSTQFAPSRGPAADETRFTGVGAPPPGGAPPPAGGPAHTTFPPGSLIGHTYRIEALLARGGMGEVYRARHIELNTDHALKIILPELANNQRIVDLFRREAAVLRTIRHDAVVAYDGVSRDENGRLYLVMEFVDGPSLAKLMGKRTFTAEEVRQLRDRLADGLAVAHDKGVIHRDLSPDNVILPGGDVDKAKIIDFGIAKMADPEQKTIVGDDFAGKFSYVSPEQLGMFGGKVDGRSDIYSLGLVLVAAAQGEPLDMGQSPISVIEARRAVPDLSRVPAAVRADLAAMLQPDPAKRPQSMHEMARPLEQRGGRSIPPDSARRPTATKADSSRMGAIIGALAVLVVAGGALGYWFWPDPTKDHDGGTTQQTDNGVKQNGTNGTGDASSTATQGTQESETGTGPTSSSTGSTVTDSEQGSASGITTATSSDGQSGVATQNETGAASNDTTSNANTATTTTDSSGDTGAGTTETAVLPVPDIEMLRTRAREAVGNLACGGVDVAVSEQGDLAAAGYVASEADRDRIAAALRALPEVGRVDNAVAVMTTPLCDALDVFRKETAYNVAAAPRIDPGGAGGVYYEGDKLKVTVTALSDGYLYIDYVDAKNDPSYVPKPDELDEYVLHLLPNSLWRREQRQVKAGEQVVIGTGAAENYTIEPPFGTYLIFAVVSPEPLFEPPRAIQEPASAYLPALRARLAALEQRYGRQSLPAASTTIVFQEKKQ